MRTPRRRLGDQGEAAAVAHLHQQGYTVLARNWRCRWGELDIIAQHGTQLVFVEVKARRSHSYGAPEEALSAAKQARLLTLAGAYLEAHGLDDRQDWRVDLIALHLDAGGRVAHLNHIISAVEG